MQLRLTEGILSSTVLALHLCSILIWLHCFSCDRFAWEPMFPYLEVSYPITQRVLNASD